MDETWCRHVKVSLNLMWFDWGAELSTILPFRGSVTEGKRRRKEHKRRIQKDEIQKGITEKTSRKEKADLTLQRIGASKQQLTSVAMPRLLGNKQVFADVGKIYTHATTYAHHFSLVCQTTCG